MPPRCAPITDGASHGATLMVSGELESKSLCGPKTHTDTQVPSLFEFGTATLGVGRKAESAVGLGTDIAATPERMVSVETR